MKLIKVKPWGEGQGDHVLIDESDFSPDFHILVEGEVASAHVLLVGAEGSGINADALIAELKSVGLIVESFSAKALARPEGDLSPLAENLLQVFEAVNAGVQSLILERDNEAQKVVSLEQEKEGLLKQAAEMLKQIESLKAASVDTEVEALKATLDKAGVTYRANASKESLQKQVAELSQQQS
ncbi:MULTISPECIES: hypothetical protein [Pseudomonas]|uniref:hypothetical protein n=1 Tax=Pseudomonas TaxID=286 RepID=UPI002F260864